MASTIKADFIFPGFLDAILTISSLRVPNSYRTELNANEVAASEKHDLALLKLEGYQTPFIKPGNTKRLAQGDTLYAIGNPMNMSHSVTSGIFSGFREDLIQTNAQISPGNSGGPLITADGEVVGVNTQKIVDKYAEGLGFAIPIDIVMRELNIK